MTLLKDPAFCAQAFKIANQFLNVTIPVPDLLVKARLGNLELVKFLREIGDL